jgi:hypothetical protein
VIPPVEAPALTKDLHICEIDCIGKSPLLMDRFDAELWGRRCHPKPEHRSAAKTLVERCQNKIYRDAEGCPILKVEHLMACLRSAGNSFRAEYARGRAYTDIKLRSFLEIDSDEIRLQFASEIDPRSVLPNTACEGVDQFDPASPWKVDVRRGVGEATGIANVLVQPRFDKWGFTVRITVDYAAVEGLTETRVKQLFERAGNRVGLLSYRPECKGPYGRFTVESIKQISA